MNASFYLDLARLHCHIVQMLMVDVSRLARESGNAVAIQRAEEASDNLSRFLANLQDVSDHVRE